MNSQEILRAQGMCGELLNGGRDICILEPGHGPHEAPESLAARVREAAETLRELQRGGVTSQKAYSPQDLSNIARMLTGERER